MLNASCLPAAYMVQVLKKNHIRFEFSTQRKNLPEHKPRQVAAMLVGKIKFTFTSG
jgi:hypothetical protein